MGGRATVPSLIDLSVDKIAADIESVVSLHGVPEELVLEIFKKVLAKGKLNPRVLQLFRATDHDQLHTMLQAMHIRDPPPIVAASTNCWLGDHPAYY